MQSIRPATPGSIFALFFFLLFLNQNSLAQTSWEAFVNQISIPDEPVITLKYYRWSISPYQSFDYRQPDSLLNKSSIQIHRELRQFHAQSGIVFPGDFRFGVFEFQNEEKSILYDAIGMVLGKKFMSQSTDRYDQVMKELEELIPALWLQRLKNSRAKTQVVKDKSGVVEFAVRDEGSDLRVSFSKITQKPVHIHNLTINRSWQYEYDEGGKLVAVTRIDREKFKYAYEIKEVGTKQALSTEQLTVPSQYTELLKALESLELEQISEQLYLVSGVARDRNIMFQIGPDGIDVFGAPISGQVNEVVIDLIVHHFPDRPIKSVYVTHAHSDHIRGLTAYFDRNIPVIADAYSQEAIRAYPPFHRWREQMRFILPENYHYPKGTKLHFLESRHVQTQSFVHFENEGLIYQGDYLEIPADQTLPNYLSETSKIFIEFIIEKGLKVDRIVGHHRNPNISMDLARRFLRQNQKH